MSKVYEDTLDHLHEIVDQIQVDAYQGKYYNLYHLLGYTLAICETLDGTDHVIRVMKGWIETNGKPGTADA